jgi:hypothetical protein
MDRDRRLFIILWLASAVVVAVAALLIYHFATRLGPLAGRNDAAGLYADPTVLFTDPGTLGTAIEQQVTAAVRDCMAAAGYEYRGPAAIESLDDLLDPAQDGYGIAAGPAAPRPVLGVGGPAGGDMAGYEAALYGTLLDDAAVGAAGCAAAGKAALDRTLAALDAMPYPLTQLEADAAAHPAWVAGLGAWSACMAQQGYTAASPEELITAQQAALAVASAEEAKALAESERQMAAADFACRRDTLEPALAQVAADLAPQFVEANRDQLALLIPPPGSTPGTTGGTSATTSTTGITTTTVVLGTGDVQVTLRWSSTVDLDLGVTDPRGDRIDYSTDFSPSGGALDVDANYPCSDGTNTPVENVFWPPGGAPAGSYEVEVAYRGTCGTPGPQDFELIIRLDGEIAQDINQTVVYGQPLTFQFSYGGN